MYYGQPSLLPSARARIPKKMRAPRATPKAPPGENNQKNAEAEESLDQNAESGKNAESIQKNAESEECLGQNAESGNNAESIQKNAESEESLDLVVIRSMCTRAILKIPL